MISPAPALPAHIYQLDSTVSKSPHFSFPLCMCVFNCLVLGYITLYVLGLMGSSFIQVCNSLFSIIGAQIVTELASGNLFRLTLRSL